MSKDIKEIGVAVLGFGTVGAGVVETLLKNGELLERRLGVRLEIGRASCRERVFMMV